MILIVVVYIKYSIIQCAHNSKGVSIFFIAPAMGAGASAASHDDHAGMSEDERLSMHSGMRETVITMSGKIKYAEEVTSTKSSPSSISGGGVKQSPNLLELAAGPRKKTIRELEEEEERRRAQGKGATSSSGSSNGHMKISQTALEVQASAHWHRIISHGIQATTTDGLKATDYTFRCRECLTDSINEYCTMCGNSSNPIRIQWNKISRRYEELLDESRLSSLPSGNDKQVKGIDVDDRTQDIRAVNILNKARSPPKRNSLITELGAKMYEDELAAQAAQDSAERTRQFKEKAAQEDKMLADQILQALRNYDSAHGKKSVIDVSDFKNPKSAASPPLSPSKPDNLSEESKKVILPELTISLLSRTPSSITVTWDNTVEANLILSKLTNVYGDPANCKYHCVYRQHMEGRDLDAPGDM
jgi:hypothetical protein